MEHDLISGTDYRGSLNKKNTLGASEVRRTIALLQGQGSLISRNVLFIRQGRRKENHSGEAQGGESLGGFVFPPLPAENRTRWPGSLVVN